MFVPEAGRRQCHYVRTFTQVDRCGTVDTGYGLVVTSKFFEMLISRSRFGRYRKQWAGTPKPKLKFREKQEDMAKDRPTYAMRRN